MKNLFRLRIFVFLILSGLFSCENSFGPEESLIEGIDIDNPITLEEARTWYNSVSKNARVSENGIQSKVFWEYAFESKMDKEEKQKVVIVPIFHGNPERQYGYKQLWIYKDKDKKNSMRVVEFVYDHKIPRAELGKYSLENFKGTMLIRDWSTDEILAGFLYEDGKPVAAIGEISEIIDGKRIPAKKSKKNARSSYYECFEITETQYGYNYVVGDPNNGYFWSYSVTWTECTWIEGTGQSNGSPSNSYNFTNYTTSGGGSYNSGQGPIYKPIFVSSECSILNLQQQNGTEINGFILTDGRYLVLPSFNNDATHSHFFTHYEYPLGQIYMIITNEGSHYLLTVYKYNTDGSYDDTDEFPIAASFHTHPSNGNENIASSYDMNFAASRTTMQHFILNNNGWVKYNGQGTIYTNGSPEITSNDCR